MSKFPDTEYLKGLAQTIPSASEIATKATRKEVGTWLEFVVPQIAGAINYADNEIANGGCINFPGDMERDQDFEALWRANHKTVVKMLEDRGYIVIVSETAAGRIDILIRIGA